MRLRCHPGPVVSFDHPTPVAPSGLPRSEPGGVTVKGRWRAAERPEPADLSRRPAFFAGQLAPLIPQTCLARLVDPGPWAVPLRRFERTAPEGKTGTGRIVQREKQERT